MFSSKYRTDNVKYQKPKGTRDLYGKELQRMINVCNAARSFFELQGYKEIQTPTFEFAELFTRSIGAHTDIVEKETYTFEVGKKVFELRPEGTASVLRAVIENKIPLPTRLMYIESMYRKEKPQKGRYREFQQIGIELIGEAEPLYDAEMIAQGTQFLDLIGAQDILIEVNSIGCPDCRRKYKESLLKFVEAHGSALCDDCTRRLQRNFLRIFDCKKEECASILDEAPKITDHLCADCATHYRDVNRYLEMFAVDYKENKKLVRGLDYYTRTVFELKHHLLGAQDTVLAGGRYDLLMKELGGADAAALGWAMGVDRLLLTMSEDLPAIKTKRSVFVAAVGDAQLKQALKARDQVQQSGRICIMGAPESTLKQQLKRAHRVRAEYAIIYGEEEAREQVCLIRNMESGEQKRIALTEFAAFLKSF